MEPKQVAPAVQQTGEMNQRSGAAVSGLRGLGTTSLEKAAFIVAGVGFTAFAAFLLWFAFHFAG